MFRNELWHELKHWLSRWTIYFYALVFIGLAFLIYAGSMGFFDPIPEEKVLASWLNSSSSLNYIIIYFHKLMLVLLPTVIGASLYKDYKKKAHHIIYSFPIHKHHYIFGRFFATLLIVVTISILVIVGLMVAEQLKGFNPNLKGPFNLTGYLQTLLLYIVPNWIIFGLVTFAIVMRTRKIFSAYLVVIIPFLIQLISENAFTGNDYLIALFDPFGQNVANYYQLDWDIQTRNSTHLPITWLLVFNRLFWLCFSMLFFWNVFRNFEFVEQIERKGWLRKSTLVESNSQLQKTSNKTHIDVLKIEYSLKQYLKVISRTATKSVSLIILSPFFWIITVFGLMAQVFIMLKVTVLDDIVLVPATQFLVGTPLIVFSMVIVLITFIYSGMLVQRESQVGMSQLLESTPVPINVFLVGKVLGMGFVQLLMLVLFIVCGIAFQLSSGYSSIDPQLYIYSAFLHSLIPILTWCLISFSIHVFIRNIYISSFILFLGWVGIQGLPSLGITTYLLRFNEIPHMNYSMFNGFGPLESSVFFIAFYWLCFGILMITLALFIYRMSDELSMIDLLKNFSIHRRWRRLFLLIIPVVIMVQLGSQIYRGEKLMFSNSEQESKFQSFKKEFDQYQHLQQPRIVSLTASIEIYPNRHSFEVRGHYVLINKTSSAIDTLLISSGFDEQTDIKLHSNDITLLKDEYMNVQLIKLEESLLPGDSLRLAFSVKSQQNNLFQRNSNVLTNGTFLQQDIFPRVGYSFSEELPFPTDPQAKERHYQSHDSDKVVIDLTIGTTSDQIGLAPGQLVRKWNENDRSYYRYRTNPMKFSFGINSASYKTEVLTILDRTIELYFLHDRLLTSMVSGLKSAIILGEETFDKYPHKVLRIVEFPLSEGSYATAYGNNLLISEARFLAKKGKANKIDIAFYVAAHETLHHWWGNELMPAYAKGATMLTESITEYLMLRILETTKGEEMKDIFYEMQSKRYQNGRRSSVQEEPPLTLVEPSQQFISYGKGAIALYNFSEVIGKDRFHQILSDFLHKYQGSIDYPTSIDFVQFLYLNLNLEYEDLIFDTFEQ